MDLALLGEIGHDCYYQSSLGCKSDKKILGLILLKTNLTLATRNPVEGIEIRWLLSRKVETYVRERRVLVEKGEMVADALMDLNLEEEIPIGLIREIYYNDGFHDEVHHELEIYFGELWRVAKELKEMKAKK